MNFWVPKKVGNFVELLSNYQLIENSVFMELVGTLILYNLLNSA
jgi:hypothetical protein